MLMSVIRYSSKQCKTIYCSCNEQKGFSPLYAASQKGLKDIVEILIEAGARTFLATEVNQIHSLYTSLSLDACIKSGDVPLGAAAERGHLSVVTRLLQANANVNSQNKVAK